MPAIGQKQTMNHNDRREILKNRFIDQIAKLTGWWIRGFAMMAIAYVILFFILGPIYVGIKYGEWKLHLPWDIFPPALRFFILLAFLYGTGNWLLWLLFDPKKIDAEKKRKRRRFGFLKVDQGFDAASENDAIEVEEDRKKLNLLLTKDRSVWTAEDIKLYESLAYLDRP